MIEGEIDDLFEEIIDDVWFVQGKNNGRYVYSNSLFIDDEKKVLLDTGAGRSILKKLIKRFGQPDIILYTHGHEDHVSEKDLFTTNERYVHEDDYLITTDVKELCNSYGIDQTPEMDEVMNIFFATINYSPLTDIKTFENQHIFDVGKYKVKALLTPGHTHGHCCYEILEHDLIFSGDIDLSRFGPFYGAMNADIMKFDSSIQFLINRKPRLLVTSHKGVYEGDDIITNLNSYRNRIWEREESILNFLSSEKTFDEILAATIIYQKLPEPKEFFLPAERIMDDYHLKLLIEKKKIMFKDNKYFLR
ncbi:MAG: MBL fold metallo-hydrolase [Candidatus Lokiarchaeota archaeon]|nr:MBL fold metallo-hydrolase [Candidatus Lokiarchaeota archaeon]